MSLEAALVIGLDGETILYRHVPMGRGAAALPDSRKLWDVYWEFRSVMIGQAHSHPGRGWPSPSLEDITSYEACESGLGRRYMWWIASADRLVVVRWRGPGRSDYDVSHVEDETPWTRDLRELSYFDDRLKKALSRVRPLTPERIAAARRGAAEQEVGGDLDMEFDLGDIVRVARQPLDLIVQVHGEVGYVDEVYTDDARKDWVGIVTMRLDGSPGGCGSVPRSCLEHEPGEAWRAVKAKIDADRAKLLAEGLERGRRWRGLIEDVAKKHGVSPETAETIFKELDAFGP